MIVIGPAGPEDLSAVLQVWAEADAEPTVTDDETVLAALVAHSPDALLVARHGSRIVGTLIVGWDGWRGSFYRLAVVPDRRRQGIAAALVEEGEATLVRLGARRLSVIAVTGSEHAVPFWRSAGYIPQTDRLRLVKNIEAPARPA